LRTATFSEHVCAPRVQCCPGRVTFCHKLSLFVVALCLRDSVTLFITLDFDLVRTSFVVVDLFSSMLPAYHVLTVDGINVTYYCAYQICDDVYSVSYRQAVRPGTVKKLALQSLPFRFAGMELAHTTLWTRSRGS
jgi:hypothetical protein